LKLQGDEYLFAAFAFICFLFAVFQAQVRVYAFLLFVLIVGVVIVKRWRL